MLTPGAQPPDRSGDRQQCLLPLPPPLLWPSYSLSVVSVAAGVTVWRYARGHVQTLRSSAVAPHLRVKRNDFSVACTVAFHPCQPRFLTPSPALLHTQRTHSCRGAFALATPAHPGQLSQTVCLATQLGHAAGPVTASLTGGASPDRRPPGRALPVMTQPIVLLYFSLGRLPLPYTCLSI